MRFDGERQRDVGVRGPELCRPGCVVGVVPAGHNSSGTSTAVNTTRTNAIPSRPRM